MAQESCWCKTKVYIYLKITLPGGQISYVALCYKHFSEVVGIFVKVEEISVDVYKTAAVIEG